MKYRVVILPNEMGTQVLSEKEWNALSLSEQASYAVVQTGFPTLEAAQRFNQDIAGEGVLVNRNAWPEPRDLRTDRRR
jgi:hypothetical protein